MRPLPLSGLRVLDFSTLLPGPMCSLLLAEAGAEVIKIERPERGDEMRSYVPKFGCDSVNFALLNRGKRSLALDLKSEQDRTEVRRLLAMTDVLIEQFRPGVMQRLGLGYDEVRAINPAVIYCSITGYGQYGPLANTAAHDLNYLAEAGMLALSAGADGAPVLPPALIADLGGGAFPAMINILLALRQREQTGAGCHLDIAMADNLFTFMYWALGNGWAVGRWPQPGKELVTGGTPRYQIYRTADGRYLAAAPLEQKFWENFLAVLGAPELLDDRTDPEATRQRVARIILDRTAADWEQRFRGIDCCVVVVRSLEEAVSHPHFVERGLFRHMLRDDGCQIPALPVPVVPQFRRSREAPRAYPRLGEANQGFGLERKPTK